MIIKKGQFKYYDLFDEKESGWSGHTRVQVSRKGNFPVHVHYVSGKPLTRIQYVEAAKEIGK